MKKNVLALLLLVSIAVTNMLPVYASEMSNSEEINKSEVVFDEEDDSDIKNDEDVPLDRDEELNLIQNQKDVQEEKDNDVEKVASVKYQAHVRNIGWQEHVQDGMMSGTTGKALSLEALTIQLDGIKENEGSIVYETHVQDIGWQESVQNGAIAGTTGRAKPIEAIKINLIGTVAEEYDVYYRVHSSNYGWFDWAVNGEMAGTEGFAYPMEAIEIRLYKKESEDKPVVTGRRSLTKNDFGDVMYQTHVQNIGWQSKVKDGVIAGTTGRNLKVEGIKIQLSNYLNGTVSYKAHVQDIGWQKEVSEGEIAGTEGCNKAMEAICINLSETIAEKYVIYYRVHVSNFGWLDWAKNGEIAGSVGYAAPIEAIQINIYEKGSNAIPIQNGVSYLSKERISEIESQVHISNVGWQDPKTSGDIIGTTGNNLGIEALTMDVRPNGEMSYFGGVSYRLHVQNIGWQNWVSDGAIGGTVGENKHVEAVQIRLTGNMQKYCDIYYRTHVSNFGWLGWAKNGQEAGTTGYNYKVEAIQIRLVPKNAAAPGSTDNRFKQATVASTEMQGRSNLYSSNTPYLILVNRSTHKVGVFQGWRGNWKCVKYWDCADGKASTPTVEGVFKVGIKGYYFDSGASRCYWYTQFKGDYLFHSVLYNKNGTLQDGRVGMALSHGCVRLKIENAKWIYDNIPSGTTVVVYH